MNQNVIETEHLLFSVVTAGEQVSAQEALFSFGVFQASAEVQPLFPNNAVGKPIPVMTEGTYFVRVSQKGQERYKEVKFTAEDIKRLASKQPRDVPFNYDHRRAPGKEGVKGWLRFGTTSDQTPLHYVGEVSGPDGSRLTALFATPELTQEAQGLIADGTYRDVSVEYRALDDVLTGCALTSYPVMRNLQFSDLATDEDEITTTEDAVSTAEESDEMKLETVKALPKEEKKAVLDTLLGDYGLSVDSLVQMGEQFKQSEAKAAKTLHELAMTRAETEINTLLGSDHFGMTNEVATATQETLAWASVHDELKFGEDGGETPDVPGVIKDLLGVIGKQGKQLALLGGPTAGKTADGEDNFGDVEETDEEEAQVTKNASSLAALAKSLL